MSQQAKPQIVEAQIIFNFTLLQNQTVITLTYPKPFSGSSFVSGHTILVPAATQGLLGTPIVFSAQVEDESNTGCKIRVTASGLAFNANAGAGVMLRVTARNRPM